MINEEQLKLMSEKPGFVAALDQSLSSTPAALRAYGIPDDTYHTKEEMLDLMHDMRSRIIISGDFSSEHIIGTILFVDTIERKISGQFIGEYLWNEKGILSFLKIDDGLDVLGSGVQLLKPIADFEEKIAEAKAHHLFGTKMRSLILSPNEEGIKDVIRQQFDIAKIILEHGLVPILEMEVDIHSMEKAKSEEILKRELLEELNKLDPNAKVILEFSLPNVPDFYKEVVEHPNVVRVLAASSGYKKTEADKKLSQNHGMIASFSRALEEGLMYQETDFEFDMILKESIQAIFDASIK